VEHPAQGWQPDPFGRHTDRWMSAGTPTALVRDGTREGTDPPTARPAPPPQEKPHWIDVDRLPVSRRRSLARPLRHLPPSYPGPPEPSRRRVGVAIAVACCSLFVSLAVLFGVKPLYIPALPKGAVVGSVVGSTSDTYIVEYSLPGQPNSNELTSATGSVQDGQSVVVRYTSFPGTVISTSAPHVRLGVGILGAASGIALIASGLASLWLRLARAKDRVIAREETIDYREDAWGGTSYSA
jgi:hypothetical protein